MPPEVYIKKTDIVAAIRAARPNLSGRQVWRAVDTIIDQLCVAISRQDYTDGARGGRAVMIGGFGGWWVNRSFGASVLALDIHSINREDGIITLPAGRERNLIQFFPEKVMADAVENIP